ncbi:MAG: hypothetical protein RI885_2014 [Actinomycetota bacterium]
MSDVPVFLTEWITGQRWYSGKGHTGTWTRIGGFSLEPDAAAPDIRIRVHLLLDLSSAPLLYQVPVTERVGRDADLEHALIGVTDEIPARYVYDGPRDPEFAAALLRLVLDEGTARPDDGSPGLAARGHTAPGAAPMEIVSSRVLSGEQSNTSIIYETVTLGGEPSAPVICKLFRTLHHGENPDVTLLSALTAAGSTVVPRSIGHITGQWRDSGEPSGFAHGHLGFAQEFLPGVEDAWRVALRAAETGEGFADRARALGETTADIHVSLAAALPTHPASEADIDETLRSMLMRFEQAVAVVPALEAQRSAVEQVHARARASQWPALQRIHGDFHLGQVLAVPGRGWVALDFEGEPLRPMSERSREDSPLRDVAGMLRSFDYAAGSVAQADPERGDDGWAAEARAAFLHGYSAGADLDLDEVSALLDAFEIDKALYEAVYEARNRPTWLPIPVSAIDRLLAPA